MDSIERLEDRLVLHMEADERSFEYLREKLDEISTDVKSLVESRGYARGMFQLALLVVTSSGGLIALISFLMNRH